MLKTLRDWLPRILPAQRAPTYAALVPQFLQSRQKLNLRPATITNYGVFGRRLERDFGAEPVSALPRADLLGYVEIYNRSFVELLLIFLHWAEGEEIIGKSGTLPPEPRGDLVKPHYLSLTEAQRFYHAVEEPFRPAFALALWAGLRPYEICRIDWQSIDIAGRRIIIEPEVDKCRIGRVIEGIPTIVFAQLALYWQPSGPIIPRVVPRHCPSSNIEGINVPLWIKVRRETAERAGVTLHHDIFRHTFATYLSAKSQDWGLVQKALGHTNVRLLRRHYDGQAKQPEGIDYFRFRPILALTWPGPA